MNLMHKKINNQRFFLLFKLWNNLWKFHWQSRKK